MTYSEAQSLVASGWMRDRIKTATSSYMNYLLNTQPENPNYANIIAAATKIGQQNEAVVSTVGFGLSGDAEFQAAGGGITDAQLQSLVEKEIQKFYPVTPPPVAEAARTQHKLPARPS